MLGLRPRLKTRPSLLDLIARYHIDEPKEAPSQQLQQINEALSSDVSSVHTPKLPLDRPINRVRSAPVVHTIGKMPAVSNAEATHRL